MTDLPSREQCLREAAKSLEYAEHLDWRSFQREAAAASANAQAWTALAMALDTTTPHPDDAHVADVLEAVAKDQFSLDRLTHAIPTDSAMDDAFWLSTQAARLRARGGGQ